MRGTFGAASAHSASVEQQISNRSAKWRKAPGLLWLAISTLAAGQELRLNNVVPGVPNPPQVQADLGGASPALKRSVSAWRSAARLHRGLDRVNPFAKPIAGALSIDAEGIQFTSKKFSRRWFFIDIHTFDLSDHDLTLTTYQNRHWHEPGEQRFHFTLSDSVPPDLAAGLVERVDRPSRNADPESEVASNSSLPVHHRALFGGSNGVLRFGNNGIDYLTEQSGDSRSWRWTDIQTVSSADRYHIIVFGYRDTYSFELKQPVPEGLMDRITDEVYARNNPSQRSEYGKER
jgi:hypothetical protein